MRRQVLCNVPAEASIYTHGQIHSPFPIIQHCTEYIRPLQTYVPSMYEYCIINKREFHNGQRFQRTTTPPAVGACAAETWLVSSRVRAGRQTNPCPTALAATAGRD